ncbi:FAD-dependent oxidoreductase [Vibrio sp. 03-59-1]|uniref:FAD-dependent oxidoreductase n=1 Tax=Vibrio sp. 03-59-1 TaxID=2607607 RepID=UPI0034620E4C
MISIEKLSYDILVVGGGFYGAYIAEHFALLGRKVLLCEKEGDLLQKASFSNQARVHNGYHYPRSVLTALKSRVSFPRFNEEFRSCIDDSFEKYYMIGQPLGKVTSNQFEAFCKRIGAPCEKAPQSILELTNPKYIEAAYKTIEYAFDAIKLKHIMKDRLHKAGVTIKYETMVESVGKAELGMFAILSDASNNEVLIEASEVFNCTYSMINRVNARSNLSMIPLKHEMTEMCLVSVPDVIKEKGITLMCGPFFSIMPFPSTDFHSFSHVRYTPHFEWSDKSCADEFNEYNHKILVDRKSAFRKMKQDAARYLPILSECKYDSSIWEVKTILPISEVDDSRPILFKQNYGVDGYHCIMGGKIDNVYDAIDVLTDKGLGR